MNELRPYFPGGPELPADQADRLAPVGEAMPVRDDAEFFDRRVDSIADDPIGAEVRLYPFEVSKIGATSLRIRSGTINGLVPTGIAGTFTMVGSGTEYVIMTVSATNAAITGATIAVGTTPPVVIPTTLGQPPTSFEVLLATVVNGKPVRTIGDGSLTATPVEVWRFAKAMPTPDAMPYDSYYSWRIGIA